MRKLIAIILVALAAAVAVVSNGHQAKASTVAVTHVVLIMEENHSSSQVTSSSMPFLTGLGNTYGKSTEVSTCLPSLPNYIDLTSGSTDNFCGHDCTPSSSCETNSNSIFGQAGASWRVLAESMPSNCDHSNSGNYLVRHTAAPYYTAIASACKAQDVPYSKSTAPNISSKFTFIVPNSCNDAHDCGLGTADSWLKAVVPKITSTTQWQSGNTLLEITFDSGGPNSRVYVAFVNPQLSHVNLSATNFTHNSLLRLNEELLGFPLLGGAKTATDYRPGLGL